MIKVSRTQFEVIENNELQLFVVTGVVDVATILALIHSNVVVDVMQIPALKPKKKEGVSEKNGPTTKTSLLNRAFRLQQINANRFQY